MITLSSFIVISKHAGSVRYERETVLVRVSRAGERLPDVPDNNFGEQFVAVCDAVADWK